MKRLVHLIAIVFIVMTLSVTAAFAQRGQGKAQRSSGAQAAYGNTVTFKSHQKKNKRMKRKGLKMVEKKKLRDSREPYRRGMPI